MSNIKQKWIISITNPNPQLSVKLYRFTGTKTAARKHLETLVQQEQRKHLETLVQQNRPENVADTGSCAQYPDGSIVFVEWYFGSQANIQDTYAVFYVAVPEDKIEDWEGVI